MGSGAGDCATGAVRRIPIGALQPSSKDIVLVALIIGKTDPRRVVMKKDGGERFVSSLTLRDSPSDIINLTLWTTREEAEDTNKRFKIGSVIEVIKPRVMNRDFGSDQEKYSPSATSPFQLTNLEGKTVLSSHRGDWSRLETLLSIPTKASAGYFSISDILENKKLDGKFVDLCVAVRSVGPIKSFKGRDGEERAVRDVKLFDLTSSCIVMKVWDNNLISLSDSWIPRQTILFLADLKVSHDSWRGCNTVSCTGKTIITENPDIGEARVLVNHCQTADFSSHSRMDTLAANINPSSISQVSNVLSLQEMLLKVCKEKDALFLANLYGVISRLDIDQSQTPTRLRCGNCGGRYRREDTAEELCCLNIDCKDYRSCGVDRQEVREYDVKVDITDETGTILSCLLHPQVIERSFGVKAPDFAELSAVSRTAFKWKLFLVPLQLSLAILLPTLDRREPVVSVVHIEPSSLQDICSKMPTPVIQ